MLVSTRKKTPKISKNWFYSTNSKIKSVDDLCIIILGYLWWYHTTYWRMVRFVTPALYIEAGIGFSQQIKKSQFSILNIQVFILTQISIQMCLLSVSKSRICWCVTFQLHHWNLAYWTVS